MTYGLVHESLTERTILLRIAPDLVQLRPFHIPVYPDTSRRPLALRAGLTLYAVLGGLNRASRFRKLSHTEWDALDGLETRKLQAVYRYFDAQTDDVELTRAVMQSALELGATLSCPSEFLRQPSGHRAATFATGTMPGRNPAMHVYSSMQADHG